MRKGTKKIRYVSTKNNSYYVFDLDEDITGKRRRLYADTEEELKRKIAEAESERKLQLFYQTPTGCRLKDYVVFYFKNAVGNIPSVKIKHLLDLFEKTVFDSEIDRDMTELTADELYLFYKKLLDKYPEKSVLEIHDTLGRTFALANSTNATDFDYSQVKFPEKANEVFSREYIMDSQEMAELLKYCLNDNCRKYGSNELVIVLALYTGLSFSKISRIRTSDVNLEESFLFSDGRKIPLSGECTAWLKKIREQGLVSDTEYLFTNRKGTAIYPAGVNVTVGQIANRCGMPNGINSKSLHKAYVLAELEKGVLPETLRDRFGYKSVSAVLAIQSDYQVRKALF